VRLHPLRGRDQQAARPRPNLQYPLSRAKSYPVKRERG
jgi:hypothetical protein